MLIRLTQKAGAIARRLFRKEVVLGAGRYIANAEYRCAEGEADGPASEEIIYQLALVAGEVEQARRQESRSVSRWTRRLRRAVLIAAVSLPAVFVGGTAFALAQPEHATAPFRGAAVAALKASSGAIALFEDVRGVAAGHEQGTISTMVQSMRLAEGLRYVPAVTVPTNDMAAFPSPDFPLFPDYVDRRYSQFRYVVSADGIVAVDTSTATTDKLLEKIRNLLNLLGETE